MEDGSEEERIARGPEKSPVTVQFDDQRNRTVGWDVQLVPRRAVQDDAQIRSRNREGQSRGPSVGKNRAMRSARTAAAGFESRFAGERVGKSQANLAVRAGCQGRI